MKKETCKDCIKNRVWVKIADFTGVSSPFEVPENPDLIVDTFNISVEKNAERIYAAIFPLLRNS